MVLVNVSPPVDEAFYMGEAFGKSEWRLTSSHLGGIPISFRWISKSFTEEEDRKRENLASAGVAAGSNSF